jgi:hypothetical protein
MRVRGHPFGPVVSFLWSDVGAIAIETPTALHRERRRPPRRRRPTPPGATSASSAIAPMTAGSHLERRRPRSRSRSRRRRRAPPGATPASNTIMIATPAASSPWSDAGLDHDHDRDAGGQLHLERRRPRTQRRLPKGSARRGRARSSSRALGRGATTTGAQRRAASGRPAGGRAPRIIRAGFRLQLGRLRHRGSAGCSLRDRFDDHAGRATNADQAQAAQREKTANLQVDPSKITEYVEHCCLHG